MTFLASLRQSQSNVTGIVGLLEIRQVTTDAGCRCALVLSAHVTGRAIQSRVHARQRKIRWRPSMVELRSQPGIDVVALFAQRRKTIHDMVGGRRLLECGLVTRITLDRQSLKLANRLALVTIGTI